LWSLQNHHLPLQHLVNLGPKNAYSTKTHQGEDKTEYSGAVALDQLVLDEDIKPIITAAFPFNTMEEIADDPDIVSQYFTDVARGKSLLMSWATGVPTLSDGEETNSSDEEEEEEVDSEEEEEEEETQDEETEEEEESEEEEETEEEEEDLEVDSDASDESSSDEDESSDDEGAIAPEAASIAVS